jgi:hypothetical protein
MISSDSETQPDNDLSRRLYRALTVDRDGIHSLLEDPSLEVVKALLKNPNLDESCLLQILKRRDLREEILKAIYRMSLTDCSHRLKVALVHHPASPDHIVLTLIPHLYLFELVTVCFLPGVTPDKRIVAERAIIKRLPETPLGSKITLARRAPSTVVEALLNEGQPHLLAACLDNPRLKQSSIFKLINGPSATAETISTVARHPRWKLRQELKVAILKNCKTPLIWFTALLPGLSLQVIKNIFVSSRITAAQKECVAAELLRRGGGR